MVEAVIGLQRDAVQQKDNLCGPFQAARVLREAGIARWDDEELDQDLIALNSGTLLPEVEVGPQVPPGAVNLRNYRFELPRTAPAQAGTSPAGLAQATDEAAAGALRSVPRRGPRGAARGARVVAAGPGQEVALWENGTTRR